VTSSVIRCTRLIVEAYSTWLASKIDRHLEPFARRPLGLRELTVGARGKPMG
jgi:hypothetical protein